MRERNGLDSIYTAVRSFLGEFQRSVANNFFFFFFTSKPAAYIRLFSSFATYAWKNGKGIQDSRSLVIKRSGEEKRKKRKNKRKESERKGWEGKGLARARKDWFVIDRVDTDDGILRFTGWQLRRPRLTSNVDDNHAYVPR